MSELKNYTITENTITINSNSEHTILKKESINKIIFDKDSIYIYIALTAAIIIKRKFLNSETQIDELKQFIVEYYGIKK